MYRKEKVILITNNSKVYDKYKNDIETVFENGYEAVLIKSRDLLHRGYSLLTHPQASSLKPNQTPYRSILLYNEKLPDNMKGILLIEKCIECYNQWQEIANTPDGYASQVEDDFKTIDLSVIDNVIERIE